MTKTAAPFGAIFDWDGVIVDSAKLHEKSWHQLAAELGKPIARDSFIRGFGMKSGPIIRDIHCWSNDPEEIARLTDRKETLYRDLLAKSQITPLPGVVEWLHELHEANVKCAVASSTPRANIEVLLDRFGLETGFTAIVAAEDVTKGKPDPEVFLTAANKLRLAPARCVVFEDAHVGIEAAHNAGMKVVAVATTHQPEELQAADLVTRILSELSIAQVGRLLL